MSGPTWTFRYVVAVATKTGCACFEFRTLAAAQDAFDLFQVCEATSDITMIGDGEIEDVNVSDWYRKRDQKRTEEQP